MEGEVLKLTVTPTSLLALHVASRAAMLAVRVPVNDATWPTWGKRSLIARYRGSKRF